VRDKVWEMFFIFIAEMTSWPKLGRYWNAFQRKDLGMCERTVYLA